ncbi:MAG TPA: hypothetical protein PKC49_15605 [Phycisphaerae bacterium]|nr:hypothetical protein [Phycisphaerae bacterium]
MLYAAFTFWLLVIIFAAWGVHHLWSALIKPRVVNGLLLPGTLVAQLGHVLGLLITGNPVQNTSLMGDDEKGEPQSDTPDNTRIPVVGGIIVGLLPLAACTACLYLVAHFWGGPVLSRAAAGGGLSLPQAPPTTLSAVWELLRSGITLVEALLNGILASNLMQWTTVLFLYLSICLTVRMTPFAGNRRGAIGAILLTGLAVGVLSTLTPAVHSFVLSSWPILSFAVGMLLFLLLLSLAVSGLVGLVRIMARNG